MFSVFKITVCLAACVLLVPCSVDAQTLSQVREEVRSAPAPKPEKKSDRERERRRRKQDGNRTYFSGNSDDSDCDDDDSVDVGFWAMLVGHVVQSPFTIPRAMAADEDFGQGFFPRYPYLHGSQGYVTDYQYAEEGTDPFLLRLRAEYFDDFDALTYWGGSILFDTSSRWGLDTEFYHRHEEPASGGTDSLWNGDANVVFRFAQSEAMQMRAGIGLNWLDDSSGTDLGFNFTYGGDLFPADPWILSGELDVGKLGSADLLHLRSTLGAQFHRVELYSGYDYLKIGSAKLHGPVFGLRLWF